ncbi:MAG: hypothetical protein AAFQ82_01275 [Myxococcota bacterium]
MNKNSLLAVCGFLTLTLIGFSDRAEASDHSNVRYGDQHLYSSEYRPWNLSINPVGWVFGSYGASLSYAVGTNVALRGDINWYNPIDGEDEVQGAELGVGVPIYFRKVYSGAFIEPGAIARTSRGLNDDDLSEIGPQILFGWHWSWDSGLNVAAALGAGRNFSSDEDAPELFGNGYLRVGYSF